MDLNECIKKGFVKRTKIDTNLINSLIEMSHVKEYTVNSAKIDSRNISAYVSLAYDSLQEILNSICISKGYKIISHICVGEFLKQQIKEFNFEELDRYRWIRKSINYYGKQIELNQGKDLIKKIFALRNKILVLLK